MPACLMTVWLTLMGLSDPMPHVRVDPERGVVELDATVVLREAQWLELAVCTPGTREHESILTTEALPSHVHAALLMIGAKPGQPIHMKGEQVVPPTGEAVAVSVRVGGREQALGEWVIDRTTGLTLGETTWVFAGSVFVRLPDREVFAADMNGSVISLVNFGDDLLARPVTTTHENDMAQLGPNTDAIPPVGTPVTLRLRRAGDIIDANDPPP